MAPLRNQYLTVASGALVVTLLTLAGSPEAWAAPICDDVVTAQDHLGEDVFLLEDECWTGEHTNIGRLTIGAAFTLQAQSGALLTIEAVEVFVLGHLSADEAGFPGGATNGRGEGGDGGTGTGAGGDGVDGPDCSPVATGPTPPTAAARVKRVVTLVARGETSKHRSPGLEPGAGAGAEPGAHTGSRGPMGLPVVAPSPSQPEPFTSALRAASQPMVVRAVVAAPPKTSITAVAAVAVLRVVVFTSEPRTSKAQA